MLTSKKSASKPRFDRCQEPVRSLSLKSNNRRFCRGFGEDKVHGCWYDFEASRERQRDFLREAEARRLARAAKARGARAGSRLFAALDGRIRELMGPLMPAGKEIPPDEESTVLSARHGLVDAVFEEGVRSVRSSSVIEFRREAEGYVIREVDLLTGDDVLYLSTEEPEWAAWIWRQKTRL
jgi:hypothetical protein